MVEHQAGLPLLMQPLRGNSSDAQDFGEVLGTHVQQWQTTDGMPYLVADSALSSAANLQKLAETAMKGMSRVPGTWSAAQALLAQIDLQTLIPLIEGYRDHEYTSIYGGMAQRWVLISSESRQPQAQRTVDQQLRTASDKEVKAWKK